MKQDKQLLGVYELLKHISSEFGDREAIYDLTHRGSYKQLKRDVDRFASILTRKGVHQADRVAVSLPSWYETVVIFFAVAKIGAILVPFNPKYKSHEVEYILSNSEPKIIIASKEFEQNVGFQRVLKIVPEVMSVRFQLDSFETYEDAMNEECDESAVEINNEVYCILYTSGTTGVPKGVMVTHRAVVQSGSVVAEELRCNEEDVFIIPSPLFHVFGMAINLVCCVSAGARMVLQEKYHPVHTLQLIEQERVTIHQGVPTMFIKELEVVDFDRYDLSTLRAGLVGASPIPPHKVKEIKGKMGIELCQSFGITETISVTITHSNDSEQKIVETLGKPLTGVEVKIVDENREELPIGEIGEIVIKSFAMMKGYYKMPEQTAEVLDPEGWYYSGDLGTLDDEGYLRFVSRKKEMIIRGGYNIYPQEIEALLIKHPKVLEAAIVGIPNEVLGEIPCAVIRLKEGEESTEEEIKMYLKQQLANYKIPEKVMFAQEFPVTASGKIQKLKLRDQVADQIGQML